MRHDARTTALGGVPPALLVAIVISVIGHGLFEGLQAWMVTGDRLHEWPATWLARGLSLAWRPLGPAVTTLMLAGFLDLAAQSPRREATVLRIGAAALGVILLVPFGLLYIEYAQAVVDRDQLATLHLWRGRLVCGSALVASGSLIVAGWQHASTRALAVPLLLMTAVVFPTRWLHELILLSDGRERDVTVWQQVLVNRLVHLGWAAAVLFAADALGRSTTPSQSWRRAGAGVYRVGSAMVARVAFGLASSALVIAAGVTRSSESLTMLVRVLPLGLVVVAAMMVTGLLQAGRLGVVGAPRIRLYLAAALTVWATTVQLVQLAAVSRRIASAELPGRLDGVVGAFPYLLPLAALASLLCALSAAGALRSRLAPADDGAIASAGVLVGVTTLAALGIGWWSEHAVSARGSAFMVTLLIAIVMVVGQLAVARVFHRLGAAMQEQPELPVATLAER